MNEPVYNIRQDVFGVLGKLPKSALSIFWGILLRVLPDGQGPVQLPSKIWADARKLVGAGIALEPEKGAFSVNPEIVYVSYEQALEFDDETAP